MRSSPEFPWLNQPRGWNLRGQCSPDARQGQLRWSPSRSLFLDLHHWTGSIPRQKLRLQLAVRHSNLGVSTCFNRHFAGIVGQPATNFQLQKNPGSAWCSGLAIPSPPTLEPSPLLISTSAATISRKASCLMAFSLAWVEPVFSSRFHPKILAILRL